MLSIAGMEVTCRKPQQFANMVTKVTGVHIQIRQVLPRPGTWFCHFTCQCEFDADFHLVTLLIEIYVIKAGNEPNQTLRLHTPFSPPTGLSQRVKSGSVKNKLGIAVEWFERVATLFPAKSVKQSLPFLHDFISVLSATEGSLLISLEAKHVPCKLACDRIMPATEPQWLQTGLMGCPIAWAVS